MLCYAMLCYATALTLKKESSSSGGATEAIAATASCSGACFSTRSAWRVLGCVLVRVRVRVRVRVGVGVTVRVRVRVTVRVQHVGLGHG